MQEVIVLKTYSKKRVRESYYKKKFPNVKRIYVTDAFLWKDPDLVEVEMPYTCCHVKLDEIYYRRSTYMHRSGVYVKKADYDSYMEQMGETIKQMKLSIMLMHLNEQGIDCTELLNGSKTIDELERIYRKIRRYKNMI
jgi:hypothetical protein